MVASQALCVARTPSKLPSCLAFSVGHMQELSGLRLQTVYSDTINMILFSLMC